MITDHQSIDIGSKITGGFMIRTTKLGFLAGVVAVAALGSSIPAAAATPQATTKRAGSTIGGFTGLESTLIAKPNADYAGPDGVKGAPKASIDLGARADTLVPTVRNKKYVGQSCGTSRIQQTSGAGKTTLVMRVEKSVSVTVKTDAKIEMKFVSAGMGWDVTRTYSVANETRFEVPKGKFGTIEAYPLYDLYTGLAMNRFGAPMGVVSVSKPVGVCFNQWLK